MTRTAIAEERLLGRLGSRLRLRSAARWLARGLPEPPESEWDPDAAVAALVLDFVPVAVAGLLSVVVLFFFFFLEAVSPARPSGADCVCRSATSAASGATGAADPS